MRPYQFRLPAADLHSPKRSPLALRTGWPGTTARFVAGLVAGSGILNLASLAGDMPPVSFPDWISGPFPVDLAATARTLTLISGFALILASIHLLERKHRAWQTSLVAASASVLFHLAKGGDVGEAICLALIAGLLWMTRRRFWVRSSKPRLVTAAMRAAGAYIIAGLYGSVGLWLLEPAAFHHNFRWWDAAIHTLRLILFLGDRTLTPYTAHAVWFINSLFWISAAAFLYSVVVLFRPVAGEFGLIGARWSGGGPQSGPEV